MNQRKKQSTGLRNDDKWVDNQIHQLNCNRWWFNVTVSRQNLRNVSAYSKLLTFHLRENCKHSRRAWKQVEMFRELFAAACLRAEVRKGGGEVRMKYWQFFDCNCQTYGFTYIKFIEFGETRLSMIIEDQNCLDHGWWCGWMVAQLLASERCQTWKRGEQENWQGTREPKLVKKRYTRAVEWQEWQTTRQSACSSADEFSSSRTKPSTRMTGCQDDYPKLTMIIIITT